jgi:hypothetical protein
MPELSAWGSMRRTVDDREAVFIGVKDGCSDRLLRSRARLNR